MKRKGLIFNSYRNKTLIVALGLMLGLCPVFQTWASINNSQSVAQIQRKVKGKVVDATGEPLIGVNVSVINRTGEPFFLIRKTVCTYL